MISYESESGNEDLYQISVLIDQLKHDDPQLRVNASKHLIQIAKALGPERSRDELIPFLNESTDDEDEVLHTIAEKLGEFVPLLGGNEYAYVLLDPLEILSAVEESAVREAAVKSIEKIVVHMPEAHIFNYFVPMLLRLASKDWFTSRISAAALFHQMYQRVEKQIQCDFRIQFLKLCTDDTPMVRRMAAMHMGNMVKVVEAAEVEREFLGAFETLSTDEQDSVRIQVIPICVNLCNSLSTNIQTARVLPVVLHIASDSSWRVRWSLARLLPSICNALGAGITNDSLVPSFEGLLSDSEAEVRSAVSANIPAVCTLLDKPTVVNRILPIVQRLVTDSSEHVRASVASVINELASVLGREDTVDLLLPLLLALLRDETSEVRLNIIANLDALNRVIGVELLSQSLLPAIVDLAEDAKWRVRLAVIVHIPKLAEHLGGQFFSEKLNALCLTWLADDVHAVRRAAAENLQKLSLQFGEQWCCQQILPRLERMHSHTNYLQRMTALYGAQVLVVCLSQGTLESSVLPFVLNMVGDAVPNVRFTVARTLQLMVKSSRISGQDVIDVLGTLAVDADRDVRYFANKAIKDIQGN